MNNNKTEWIAVRRIEDVVIKSEVLEPYIDKNDKTPSWDGNIFVYKSSHTNKANLKGKIPIQIKGTNVTKFSNEVLSFPFEISDLKNYLTDGGVLFFVVEIIDINDVRIYYKSLLPIDITSLLSKTKDNQKKVSSTLKLMDVLNTKYLESICFDFLFHRELQYSTVKYSKSINKFKFVNFRMFTGRINPNKYLLENEIYIYGKENKNSVLIPIDKISVEVISHQVSKTISIDSKVYFNNYKVSQSKNNSYITINNNIIFFPSKGKLKYKSAGNLIERLKEAQFLDHLVKKGYFFIGDFKVQGLNILQKEAKQIHKYLKYLTDVNSIIRFFNIKDNLNMNSLDQQDYNKLDILIDNILYNKKVKFNMIETGFQYINIGNINILVLIIVGRDKTINIYNYFSTIYKKFECSANFGKDKKNINTSFYSLLKANDIAKASNLDLNVVENEVKGIKLNYINAGYINNLILELVKSYDIDKKFINSLYVALRLCEKLEEYDNISLIYKINRLQIIKRLRTLRKEEKQKLINIRINKNNDFQILCAISILLDNKSDFEYYFEKLSDSERKEFIEYPIYGIR